MGQVTSSVAQARLVEKQRKKSLLGLGGTKEEEREHYKRDS